MMLGILKFGVCLPLHYNLCFDLHSVETDRQLIVSLSFSVLGVAPNKVDFSSFTHTNFVGDSDAVEEEIKHTITFV
jgi:hypothetical protein